MAIYVAGIGMIYLCRVWCNEYLKRCTKEFAQKIFVFGSFSFLFMISALRSLNVGLDTVSYAKVFYKIQQHSFLDILSSLYCERVEFGYAFLNKLIGCIIPHHRAIIVVCSFVVCYGMAYYIYKYVEHNWSCTAIILFASMGLYLSSLNITRQIMALVLHLNAWGAFQKKKNGWALVLSLIGVSFHILSFVFFVVYLVYICRNNKKLVGVFLIICVLVMLSYRPIIELFSKITNAFSYLDNSKKRISVNGIKGLWMLEILLCVYFFLCYFCPDKIKRLLPSEGVLNLSDLICVPAFSIFYIILTIIGTKFNYFDRLGLFFLPFCMHLFINAGKVIKEKIPRLYHIYLVSMHICFVIYFLLGSRSYVYQFGI